VELAERISEAAAAPAPAPAAAEVVSGQFDQVIVMIDKIVELLKEEEKEDLETKEECEKTRMESTRGSILLARDIDELSDTITSAKAKIAELEAEVEEKESEVKAIEEELEAATKIRQEEAAAHAKTDKDDEDAAATIVQAIEVLEGFYKAQGGTGLIQRRKLPSNDYVAAAGEAPPPPPATWEDPTYAGRDKESSGILAILTMIKDDIDKDRAKAQKAEDASQKHYDEFSKECGDQVNGLNGAITELQGTIGEKETEVEEAVGQRSTKKGELTALIESIKGMQPGCDYMLVNYVVRSAKRKIEIDGLEKAKAILKGAAFDESDPNRELVPGDALVQKK
jgi:chromosome segregation ATPase